MWVALQGCYLLGLMLLTRPQAHTPDRKQVSSQYETRREVGRKRVERGVHLIAIVIPGESREKKQV